jgi:hypothetical protein
MTKQEMKSQLKLDSPNMADAVAMQMLHTVDQESGNYEPIEYESW